MPRPIILYVGAMDAWFDFRLLETLADKLTPASFVLVGPDGLARERLLPRPNLHLLGPRSFDELPSYLHNADVGIIPFDVAGFPELVNCIHPLKLYEYMACGLPVVSVEWDEIRDLKSPACLVRTPDEFCDAIRRAVSRPPDRHALVEYAKAQDWDVRLSGLAKELGL